MPASCCATCFVCFQGCHTTTAWSDSGSFNSETALQSLPALERTIASSGPNANLHAFLSNTQPAANRPATQLPATFSSQAALAKENYAPVTDRAAVGFDSAGEGAQSDAVEQAHKLVGSCSGADTKLACGSMHTDQYEGSGCISQRQILGNRAESSFGINILNCIQIPQLQMCDVGLSANGENSSEAHMPEGLLHSAGDLPACSGKESSQDLWPRCEGQAIQQ